MGSAGSKKQSKQQPGLRERLLRARRGPRGESSGERQERSLQYPGGSDKGLNSPSCDGQKTLGAEGGGKQDSDEDDEDNEVGVRVRPGVPLRPMTFKLAVDMSHFLKEKGELEGIFYSERRHKILDTYLENEEGIVSGWQNYTHGPGVRYPKFFGWLWKLVPINMIAEPEDEETHCLVHPAQTSAWDDPHEETLVWQFDSLLAYDYVAFSRFPEEFGYQSGMPEKEWKAKLRARGIPTE
ncbi:nef [Human immunodeficiency virus 2]|uniref:Protein Nef n=1 Tax=Human immunodeficiency virus type 2 subtype B (isolate EHO) TaxID=388821 RepID=NEF_HV2EH|nr:RecName: Full=Protein Nef; AltName: Full=3'ORF; AltName: Full=Negative factor; Short=F-protein [HIV-2 B_EHO]AAC54474.1 nef [Human immunodeficiency virus 2]prf//2120212J nef gene [Human immunodeficiency virus 2]